MSTSNYQKSRQVLGALVQGVDPETGSEFQRTTSNSFPVGTGAKEER